MKQLLLSMLFVLMSCVLLAQTRTISGRITDGDTGEGLPGVTIAIKGTTSGTTTDLDGNYTLSVDAGQTLVISYIGYATQEVVVGAQTTIDLQLSSDIAELSEVVIIGYGETTIKDATGAVAAVSSKDFNGGVISSPEQLIQGKTAGVQITSASGNPGDGVQLRIRGTNSVRSNNNPLFVVDGVPLSNGATASANIGDIGTSSDVNPLNFLNPSDIESVSILKDASAAAIYGSRGANGVIFITTKDGAGQRGTVEFSSSLSVASSAKEYDLLKADEAPFFLTAVGAFGGNSGVNDFGSATDWQDFVLRTAVSHKQNLAYSKTFGQTNFRASFGYENQNGIVQKSNMERISGRIAAGRSFLNDRMNVNLTTSYSTVNREDPPLSGSAGFKGDLLGAAYSANPTWPTDPDFNNTGGQVNPANMLEYFQSTATTNRLIANISIDYELTSELVAKVTYGADWSNGDRIALLSSLARNQGNGIEDFGQGGYNNNESFSNLIEATLNYKKSFGALDLDVLGGYSFQSFRNKFFSSTARGFAGTDFKSMENDLVNSFDAADNAASSIYSTYNNWGVSNDIREGDRTTGGFVNALFPGNESAPFQTTYFDRPAGVNVDAIAANFSDQTDFLQSFFGRANLKFNDKYLLTLTVRGDGSSTFGDNNKYGIFPSGAFAWQIHDEQFAPDIFSTLKLRLGYGIVGNQDGLGYGNFVRRTRWEDANVGDNREIVAPGIDVVGNVNPDLKWEETTQSTVGLDFGLNNERFYGTVDFYLKETKDLLLRTRPPQPSPTPLRFENLSDAIVENKGWELSLGAIAVENDDLTFTIEGNVAHNKNLLKNFEGQLEAGTIRGPGLSRAFAQLLTGGQPLFSYYVREFVGFDGNGQPIRDEQKLVGKSALPVWNAGLSFNLIAGNFDFSAYLTGQFDFWIYNNTQNAFFTAGQIGSARNVTEDVLNTGESPNAAAAVSERFLSKGDFIRMQSLTLGYNVPVENSNIFRNLRFTFNAQNLFLISDYNGLDPEVATNPANIDLQNELPTAGIDYTSFPRPRIFTLGLNATF